MDDFEEFKTSVEEVIADVVEMARELALEVEPEVVTELGQSHDKTLMDEELLPVEKQRKYFFWEGNLLLVKMVEITTKDLNLVDKAAGFERIDSNFERSSVGKALSNSTAWYREIVHERKSQSMWQISLLSYEIATAIPTFNNHSPDQQAAINVEARPSTSRKVMTHWRLRWWLAFFSNKVIFN